MSLNYDPDGVPPLTPNIVQLAEKMGFHPVHFVCDEQHAKVGDHTGVSFWGIVPFLPRKGDRITLEDGNHCIVQKSLYRVSDADGVKCLIPTVYAIRVSTDSVDP